MNIVETVEGKDVRARYGFYALEGYDGKGRTLATSFGDWIVLADPAGIAAYDSNGEGRLLPGVPDEVDAAKILASLTEEELKSWKSF